MTQGSILDQLDNVEKAAKDGLAAIAADVAGGRDALAKEVRESIEAVRLAADAIADKLLQEINGARGRTIEVPVAGGEVLRISERDALQVLAAGFLSLNRGSPVVYLASGQTQSLPHTNFMQLCEGIAAQYAPKVAP